MAARATGRPLSFRRQRESLFQLWGIQLVQFRVKLGFISIAVVICAVPKPALSDSRLIFVADQSPNPKAEFSDVFLGAGKSIPIMGDAVDVVHIVLFVAGSTLGHARL